MQIIFHKCHLYKKKKIILVHCKLGDMRNPRPKYKLIYNLNF